MKNIMDILNRYNVNIPLDKLLKNSKQRLAVMCFAFNEEEELLLMERYNEPFKGQLVPPGGKVHLGEDIINASKREFLEETSFDFSDIELKVITSEIGPEYYNWIFFIFKGRVKKAPLIECNEGILKWVKKDKLMDENLTSIDKKILPYIFSNEGIYYIDVIYGEDKREVIKENILL